VYKSPSAFGSGSVIRDALSEGFREARSSALKIGTAAGAVGTALGSSGATAFGTGAAIGAGHGFLKGAARGAKTASPDVLVDQFSKIKNRLNDIDNQIIRSESEGALRKAASIHKQIPLQAKDELAAPVSEFAEPDENGIIGQGPEGQPIVDPFQDFEDLELDLSPLGVEP